MSSVWCVSQNYGMAWEVECLGVGLRVGGLCPGIMELCILNWFEKGTFSFLVLFFYNHIMLVKVINVMIILRVHTFTFLCVMY